MNLSKLEGYIETGNTQELDLLLRSHPELVKETTSHDVSPLLLSCYYNKPAILQVILRYTKTLTIHEACAAGLFNQVEAMVQQIPAVVNEISAQGFSPLGIAAHFGKEDIVRHLLMQHADPNIPSQNGYHVYPLQAAISNNFDQVAKLLIQAEAEVNVTQASGLTPLHLAAQSGNIELIICLLENGADITVQADGGFTAADLAKEKGFREIADILSV